MENGWGRHHKPLENRAARDMTLCPQLIERTMNASIEATLECLFCLLTQSMRGRRAASCEYFLCLKQQSADHFKPGTMFTPMVGAISENLRGSELSLSPVSSASGETHTGIRV